MNNNNYVTPTTATVIAMNAMIGAGIFSMPMALYAMAGPAGLCSILFVATTIWCLAYTLGKIAEHHKSALSFYHYIEPWGGARLAHSVVALYSVGMVTAMGVLTRALGNELHALFPAAPACMWSGIIIASITLVLMRGITLSTIGQYTLIICTLLPIIGISLLCLMHGSLANLIPWNPHGTLSIIAASKVIIFGYFGFECITSLTPFLRNPSTSLPTILTVAITAVSLLYFVFILSIMLAIPSELLNNSQFSFMHVLMTTFPHYTWLLNAVTVGIISAIVGTLHAMLWAATSLLSSNLQNVTKAFSRKIIPPVYVLLGTSITIFVVSIQVYNLSTLFSLVALAVVPTYFVTVATVFQKRYQFSITTKVCGAIGWLASVIITLSALYTMVS